MSQKYSIYCTLGPSTLNSNFLKFANKKKKIISLLRLNLSHLDSNKLKSSINLIRKYTSIPICLDTEGAQIRTRLKGKKIFLKKNASIIISSKNSKFDLYPNYINQILKLNDILDIGFENLILKLVKKDNKGLIFKCINPGYLETNKGVHLKNRNIKLDTLTEKDFYCIELSKKLNIKNFALSFTNSIKDIKKFRSLLTNHNRIYKIETLEAVKNFSKFVKIEKNFLIDRGDLSKDISIKNIPQTQRYLFKFKKRNKVEIAVATNLLESMIINPYPTRAEANDIYNSLEMGCSRLVLAGETAVGNNPKECINFLEDIINVYKKNK